MVRDVVVSDEVVLPLVLVLVPYDPFVADSFPIAVSKNPFASSGTNVSRHKTEASTGKPHVSTVAFGASGVESM